MSVVTRLHCDGCHREVERDTETLAAWLHLDGPFQQEYDFCSLGCVESWLHRRHIKAVG